LGLRVAQTTAIIILIFLRGWCGLALSLLVSASNGSWLKFRPKPGAWMARGWKN